jgi:hypothetical protein
MAPALKHESNGEHPVVAWVGILAVLLAILLILWARFEVHGTRDLEAALSQSPPRPAAARQKPSPEADKAKGKSEVDDAVAAGRWATGFSR